MPFKSIPEQSGKQIHYCNRKKRTKQRFNYCCRQRNRNSDPKISDRIFEPKFTTKSSGMGLGLGIIKNIIENYKGTITFETEFGKGTTFTVSLPIINS